MSNNDLQLSLQEGLSAGDIIRVQALIDAGADIRYTRAEGYDALIDAVHGRDVYRDAQLLDLLTLLISNGVNLSGVTSYGESGLRVLSRLGRFDAVKLLLDAGADYSHLEWTPLMDAVATGTLSDVDSALKGGASLEASDRWSRTAFLIALLGGDIAKAELLLAHGANPNTRGNFGAPPLFYAVGGHHPAVVSWMLRNGADIHLKDISGATALMEAAEHDDAECLQILLSAGADIDHEANGTALYRARTRDCVMALLNAGADPQELSQGGRRSILGFAADPDENLLTASDAEFKRASYRRFGRKIPERMVEPFWLSMIRAGVNAYAARLIYESPYKDCPEPIWCAKRFGQSITFLPDGRIVQIGGEHEDFYDPDFCIYNDVFVHNPDGSIEIYGYPESVFPPTDFHTATLIGGFIYLIGSLGHWGKRRYGETPIYRLDTRTLAIERLRATGDAPGWIYKHRAIEAGPNLIRIWSGERLNNLRGKEVHEANEDVFILNLDDRRWRHLKE